MEKLVKSYAVLKLELNSQIQTLVEIGYRYNIKFVLVWRLAFSICFLKCCTKLFTGMFFRITGELVNKT